MCFSTGPGAGRLLSFSSCDRSLYIAQIVLSVCFGRFGFIGINSQKTQTSSKIFLPGRIYFRALFKAPYALDLIFLNPKTHLYWFCSYRKAICLSTLSFLCLFTHLSWDWLNMTSASYCSSLNPHPRVLDVLPSPSLHPPTSFWCKMNLFGPFRLSFGNLGSSCAWGAKFLQKNEKKLSL